MGGTKDTCWGNSKCKGEERSREAEGEGLILWDIRGPSEKVAFRQRPARSETDGGEGVSPGEV